MDINLSNPLELIVLLVGAALMPFVLVMITPFTRIIVVLSLLRNGLGLQSTPPNIVLNGLAMIMSVYITYPVLVQSYEVAQQQNFSEITMDTAPEIFAEIAEPFRRFMEVNSTAQTRELFLSLAKRTWPPDQAQDLSVNDLVVIIPAFITNEVSLAFQIGFIIYLPFVIVDLVVSNILLALGMVMLSPTTISLPFKLLLFTLVNGWGRLFEGLVLSYQLFP